MISYYKKCKKNESLKLLQNSSKKQYIRRFTDRNIYEIRF